LDLGVWVVQQLGLGEQLQVNDVRERPPTDIPELVGIPLRPYQHEAVDIALAAGRGVIDLPPRSGKTRMMIDIVRQVATTTVWLTPKDRIAKQTIAAIEGFMGENYGMHLIGSAEVEAAKKMRVVVCTAATAYGLPKEFYETRNCIVIDEFHHASSPSYAAILKHCDHIYFRFGMTGTFFRSGNDVLALYAQLSRTLYKLTSGQLKEMGYLIPVHTVFIPCPFPRLRGIEPTWSTGYGKLGIHKHKPRNQLVAYTALFLQQTGRTVLILVGTKEQGYQIQSILNSLLPPAPFGAEFKTAEFISTDMKRGVQTRVLESFGLQQEVKVLIGTSLLGEGVDMPSADALVLARGEKAEVSLVQAMYRICTAQEGKTDAILADFADRHNSKLLEHSLSRLEIYHNDEIFDVTVLQDPGEFPAWLHKIDGGERS